ncbi:hypothetical protein LTR95_006102 [Oleoguttula sp. CCFEE 5521]
MVPSPITEDYYRVLEVDQGATVKVIKKSYRRLALKLHPDRNASKLASSEAFQLLGNAYETLADESRRRAYDVRYASIKRDDAASQGTQRPAAASGGQSESLSDIAQIAQLQKGKTERAARWRALNVVLESSLFELRRGIRVSEEDIENLSSIAAAEAAEELQKNSWLTWVLFPLYKRVGETVEERDRKSIARQERRVEKDMKERRLSSQQKNLRDKEQQMLQAKKEYDASDRYDSMRIAAIEQTVRERESQARLERERLAKVAAMLRAQEVRQQREAEEFERSRRAAEDAAAAEILRQYVRKQQKSNSSGWPDHSSSSAQTNRTSTSRHSTCDHRDWWDKMQGRAPCPRCGDVWLYMLQCPRCATRACPKCQSELRPRGGAKAWQADRQVPPRVRVPSPEPYDGDWY